MSRELTQTSWSVRLAAIVAAAWVYECGPRLAPPRQPAALRRGQPPALQAAAPAGSVPPSSSTTSPAAVDEAIPRGVAADSPSAIGTGPAPVTTSALSPSPSSAPSCPADMVHVHHEFCPDLRRHCARSEYDPANHLTICHRFTRGSQECRGERRLLDFCIDVYEYPNRKGAHPPVMIDWHEANRLCERENKRLCTESEWVAACEGPEETPFPYGWERSARLCNIDNPWIEPSLRRIYSTDSAIREAELKRLDQGVLSGSMETCRSGYGVYDLTGNFDEWTQADRPRPQARGGPAALKGGAWGHVRNACRPVTTSHAPAFRYYFVSTRCCRDPEP